MVLSVVDAKLPQKLASTSRYSQIKFPIETYNFFPREIKEKTLSYITRKHLATSVCNIRPNSQESVNKLVGSDPNNTLRTLSTYLERLNTIKFNLTD